MRFWGEQDLHAAYMNNVTGSKADEGRIPCEMAQKCKPNV